MIHFVKSISVASALLLCLPPALAQMPELVDVYTSGQDGYHTYRIPAIIATKKGTLLAFCEGRKTSGGDHGDIDLILKRSTDLGKSWSKQSLIHEEGDTAKITIGNPAPVVDQQTGFIWLIFNRNNDTVLVTHSEDDGLTWAAPKDITKTTKLPGWDWYAAGPGNGIQLTTGKFAGRLVIPCDHRVTERGKGWNEAGRSHIIYSDDHGKTWKLGGVTDWSMNEAAIAEMSNGDLMLNMRSYRGLGERGVSFSKSGGVHWRTTFNEPLLIESVCQGSFIKYAPKKSQDPLWHLFSNPATKKGRHHMTVRLSKDEAQTWPYEKLIYEGSAAYSNLVQLPNGDIGLIFERDGYGKISFTSFPIESLQQKN